MTYGKSEGRHEVKADRTSHGMKVITYSVVLLSI